MKVLVVAPSLRTRGGITSVVQMHMQTAAWSEAHCEHLATHEDGSSLIKARVAFSSYAKALIKVAQADIVHLHVAGEHSLLRKLPIAALAKLMRKPYIAHIHASGPDSLFERTPKWATQWMLENAAQTVALSESWARDIRNHVPEATVQVIPNPVKVFPAKELALDKTVLYAGKLESRKGYRTLLEAAVSILREHPDARFVFAGHGEMEQAKAIADQLGIAGSVEIAGWASREQMDRLYRSATIFCLPSRNEGVPMSVLEAMSYGVPVVCTPVGGLPEIIVDGTNGVMTKVDDVESLSRGILLLLNGPMYAASVGEAGRKSVQKLCSLESVDRRLSRLYDEVVVRGMRRGSELERAL